MYFIQYAFMCLIVGAYLFFQLNNTPVPGFFYQLNTWAAWAFLVWGGYYAVRVIVDCILLSAKSQMTAANAWNGVLLAVLNFLPVLGMSFFLLRQGFVSK